MRLRFRFLYTLSVIFTLGSGTGCNRDATGTVAPGGYVPAKSVAETPPQRPAPVFSREVAPLFDKYCLRCHDGSTADGGVSLDVLSDGIPDVRHRPLLVRVADNLRSEYMPPAGEPRPSESSSRRSTSGSTLYSLTTNLLSSGSQFVASIAPSITTPFATCLALTCVRGTSFRSTMWATVSTISPTCSRLRRFCWKCTWPPPRESSPARSLPAAYVNVS